MEIKEIMKRPIVIERDLTLSEAARLMTKHGIHSLIVVKDEKVSGIITQDDLVRHFGEMKKVSEVMTKEVITLKASDKVQKAMDLILEKHVSVVPILEKGKLAGVIHTREILERACDSEDFLMD